MARSPHRLLSEKKSTSSMLFDKSSTRPGLSGEAGSRASSFLRAEKTTSLREGGGGLGAADGAGSKPHMFGRLSKNDATKLAREGAKGSAGDVVGGALDSSVASGEMSDQAGATSRSTATATSLAAGRESARLAKKGVAANQDLMGSGLNEFNKTAPSKKSIGEKRTKLGEKAEKARYKSWEKAGKLEDAVEGGGKKGMSRFGKGAKSAADGAGSAAAAGKPVGAASGKAASKIAFRRKSATRAVRVNAAAVKNIAVKAGSAVGTAVASTVSAITSGVASAVTAGPLAAIALVFIIMAVAGAVGSSVLSGIAYTELNKSNGGEQLAAAAIREHEKYQSGSYAEKIKMVAAYHTNAGFGGDEAWCSMFVYWCWCQCGFDKSIGIPPGVGMANSWINWAAHDKSAGQVIKYDSNYTAKKGDIIVDGEVDGVSNHVGIVVTDGKYGDFEIVDGNPVVARYHVGGSFSTWQYVFRANFPNTGGSGLGEGVNFNMSERASVREWAPRIDAYIARVQGTHAPLYGHGECFARSAYRGKMDPRWLPVISFFESNCGLAAWGTYNCYGWGVTDSGATSVAYANGYDSMIAFILENASGRGNGWAGSKVLSEYTSIEELDDEYCSSSAGRVALIKAHMMSI